MYFRPLGRQDLPFLVSLFDNEEYEQYFAENDTTEEEFAERFQFWSNKENRIICEDDGQPLGWVLYQLDGDTCHLDLIVVRYSLVGSGVGYRAFDRIVRSLSPAVRRVKLDVQQRNRHAVDFYLRYGFQIISEERQPVGSGTQMYYNMELTLNTLMKA